jgi:hypothetical protein
MFSLMQIKSPPFFFLFFVFQHLKTDRKATANIRDETNVNPDVAVSGVVVESRRGNISLWLFLALRSLLLLFFSF